MNRIQTDSFSLTRDEAVELTIHHLRLASMFFEAVPDENEEQLLIEELDRQLASEIIRDDKGNVIYLPAHYNACASFITLIVEAYEMQKLEK